MASFQTIIYQMILAVLRDAKMTSANPTHTNTFKGLTEGSPEIGLDSELQEAISQQVKIAKEESNTDVASPTTNIESSITSNVSRGISTAKNPASIVSQGLGLLPHAVLVSFAISLAPLIFEEMTKAGGVLDLRLKRILEDEFNAFLSLQTQKDTQMGTRQVIVQAKTGFHAASAENSFNTLQGIREGGINKERQSRLGVIDHSKGVF